MPEEISKRLLSKQAVVIKIATTCFFLICHPLKNFNWRVQIMSEEGKIAPLSRSISKEELINLYCKLGALTSSNKTLKDFVIKAKSIIKKLKNH